MANIISNEKRHIQDKKKYGLAHSQKSSLKTQIKKTKLSKENNDLNKSYKLIDSAINKNIITKNKANRLKSNLKKYCAKTHDSSVNTKKVIKKTVKKNAKKIIKTTKKNKK